MKCDYCGYEFEEKDAKQGCGSCHGGCNSIHCPRCNYKIPVEPALIKKIRKLFSDTGSWTRDP